MKHIETSPQHRPLSLLTAALAALGLVSSAHAQLQTAPPVFVNIDATTLPEGSLSSITNNGTLGGFFEAVGGGSTVPSVATFGGTKGIQFNGSQFMKLVGTLGGATTPAPAGITGANPTSSVEVWAMNPDIAPEEAMVSWGKRGGPCGANNSCNYGNNPSWGAMARWCGRDMGWDDNSQNNFGAPSVKQWHYLVYTYDGTTTRLYVDGALSNSEGPIDGDVSPAPDTSINLACQTEPDGVTPSILGSLTVGRMRIHDEVLTGSQISNNYNFEKNDFVNPSTVVAEQLSGLPANRYSFSEPATNNAGGLTFADSIGGVNGIVQGAGAQFSGTRLILPGGPSSTQSYGDLPNGIISSRSVNNGGSGEITFEGWCRVTASINWTRIFDFGSAQEGEVFGPGGFNTAGADYLFYSAQEGPNTDVHQVALSNLDAPPGAPGGNFVDVNSPGTFGNDLHFVITWKESTGEIRVYENGVEINAMQTVMSFSDINDVNDWLGRSNFTFDNDTAIEYDEFRVYNRVLSPGEVLGNFQAGPNTLNTGTTPVSLVAEPVSATVFDSYAARFTVATAGSPIISYQWKRNGSTITNATNAVYSFTVGPADNNAQFSCTVSNNTGTPNVLTSSNAVLTVVTQAVTLQHRYSFNETSGTVATDSVGGANGDLIGGAAFTGTGQMTLDGTNGYVNLPNDLVLNNTNITVEAWVADNGSGVWSRIFDFGNSSGGEDFAFGPGSPESHGTQYFYLTQPSLPGPLRGTISIDGNAADLHVVANIFPLNQMKHIVFIINGPMHTGRLFVDGVQVGENTGISLTPAGIGPTVNDWLGRGQYNGDPLFHGSYDEFRIWDGAMTPAQAAASFAIGPNFESLRIAISAPNQVTVSWPSLASGFVLEKTATLLDTNTVWQAVTNAPSTNGNFLQVTLPVGAGNQFLRLRE